MHSRASYDTLFPNFKASCEAEIKFDMTVDGKKLMKAFLW